MKINKELKNFINKNTLLRNKFPLIINENKTDNFLNHSKKYNSILNLELINNIKYINKHLEYLNSKLYKNGELIIRFESFQSRRSKLKIKNFKIFSDLYLIYEFFLFRYLPKSPFKKIYYFFFKNKYRHLSKAEVFGRIVSCGFNIINYFNFKGYSYVLVEKISLPKYDNNPTYGALISLKRLGKNNKIINVYKFRTMHPFSEYLHDFTLKKYGYGSKGKPKNDFRLTPWGKFLRKFWIDELPQLYNLIRGDLKIVGIRPVGVRFFKDIPIDLQNDRKLLKPGCIPPYVCLNKKNDLKSIFDSERRYINDYNKSPIKTDTIYFFYALINILLKGKRSQ